MKNYDKVDQVLAHHGIKGMKWGVRRFQPYPKGAKGEYRPTKGSSEEPKKSVTRSTRRPNVKDLSDQELRDILNRADLERRYAQLTASEKSQGKKLVEKLVINPGLDALAEYNKKYMVKQIEAIMNPKAPPPPKKKK